MHKNDNFGKNARHAGIIATAIVAMMLLPLFSLTDVRVQASDSKISYKGYATELRTYVDGEGKVNYRGLKTHRMKLDSFAAMMSELQPEAFEKWKDQDKIAFWINAYNALTLTAILNNYPIKASFFRSLRFSDNSIRQIPGVWDELKFSVMDQSITLDGIEHDILRKKYDEPRIHMALVCAAMGCPPLRSEPYTGEQLDTQLNDQTTRFLSNPKKFRIDRKNRTVYLSPIFKWFGIDFVKKFGTEKEFSEFPESQRAVLNFITGFVKPEDKAYLEKGGYSIEYLTYDWSLNEQKK
jgi:hypothetical protein